MKTIIASTLEQAATTRMVSLGACRRTGAEPHVGERERASKFCAGAGECARVRVRVMRVWMRVCGGRVAQCVLEHDEPDELVELRRMDRRPDRAAQPAHPAVLEVSVLLPLITTTTAPRWRQCAVVRIWAKMAIWAALDRGTLCPPELKVRTPAHTKQLGWYV